MPVTELCEQEGSFVLLAADGTGKTTVLRSLRAHEPGAVEVNLSTLGKAEIRGKLEAAAASGAPVYLDAVDSAARLEPALYDILREYLVTADAARVPWRLACRPAACDPGLTEALRAYSRPLRELRLLPLTRTPRPALRPRRSAIPAGSRKR